MPLKTGKSKAIISQNIRFLLSGSMQKNKEIKLIYKTCMEEIAYNVKDFLKDSWIIKIGKKREGKMKASEKKNLLKHIAKDSKEFRSQLKEDEKLKKEIRKSSSDRKR